MIPEIRIPTHPGVVLKQEFLDPLEVTQVAFAAHLGVPVQRINELIRGKRGVTPETAWLLSQALNTTPEFWMNLQSALDLARSRPTESLTPLREIWIPAFFKRSTISDSASSPEASSSLIPLATSRRCLSFGFDRRICAMRSSR